MNENNNSESAGFGEVTEREPSEDTATDTQTETVGDTSTDTETETTEGQTGGNQAETGTEEAGKEEVKPQLTEKGTKLDENPESAAHQLLANERAKASKYEKVLSNPELLAKFLDVQYGIKLPAAKQEEAVPLKTYKPEDFENIEGVTNAINDLIKQGSETKTAYEATIKELKDKVQNLERGGQQQQVAATMSKDVSSLRSAPELDPKSPDFIEGLEEEIANLYHTQDFDEKTGTYRGNVSLAKIGEQVIGIARKARQQGSIKAQTVVKEKAAGKVKTSSTTDEGVDSATLSPAASIAAGIAKMGLR